MNPHRLVKLSSLSKHSAAEEQASSGINPYIAGAGVGIGALAGAVGGGAIYDARLGKKMLSAFEARLDAEDALSRAHMNRSTTPGAYTREVRRTAQAREAYRAAEKALKTKPGIGRARAAGGLLGLTVGLGTGLAIDHSLRNSVQ